MKGLSLTDILTHLKDKIDLAAAHEQDDKSKQQTLNATIDCHGAFESWEQFALMWCALFRNGFYLESAEDVVAFDDDESLGFWILSNLCMTNPYCTPGMFMSFPTKFDLECMKAFGITRSKH